MGIMLPLGVGRQALHPPSPSPISSAAMKTSEEEGLHFRPSSSHCGSALRRCFIVPYDVFRFISIEKVAGIDILCFDKTNTLTQIIMILVSKFPNVRLQSKSCCRQHYWIRSGLRHNENHNLMSCKSKQSAGQFGP